MARSLSRSSAPTCTAAGWRRPVCREQTNRYTRPCECGGRCRAGRGPLHSHGPAQGKPRMARLDAAPSRDRDRLPCSGRALDQELPDLPAQVRVVEDAAEGRGPLQGLAAGLDAVADEAEVAYVSSTDVPLLHPAFARAVLRAGSEEDVDVALPVVHGFRHPLAAAYRTSLLPAVEELIEQDRMRPAFLFERSLVREL